MSNYILRSQDKLDFTLNKFNCKINFSNKMRNELNCLIIFLFSFIS